MIDNRKDKIFIDQIEPYLENLTETDILKNFQMALNTLYPYLIPIYSFCYDSWDDIVENLYDEMVLNTFCWKFGLRFEKNCFHRYAYEIGEYRNSHHIECLFNTNKVKIMYEDGINKIYPVEYFVNKKVIFAEFCDGKHNLTGTISHDEAKNIAFNLVKAFLIDGTDGTKINVYLDANYLNFALVLEDINDYK